MFVVIVSYDAVNEIIKTAVLLVDAVMPADADFILGNDIGSRATIICVKFLNSCCHHLKVCKAFNRS